MSLLSPSDNGSGLPPDCSIIIPVFNGYELTRQCVDTLLSDQSEHSFEIIVVDNASSDGVESYLEGLQDRLTLIRNSDNIGFARANNQALEKARGKYIVYLNNDTVPEPGWLDAMVETVESDEKIAVVGSKLLYPETDLIQHAGVVFSADIKVNHIYEGFPGNHPAVNYQRDFQSVTAACMLVRAEICRELGGFDERFINGFEDVDFCLRIGERGWRIVYQPRSVVMHHTSQSAGRHTHETANAVLLWNLWSHKIRPDNSEYYRKDGFKLITDNGKINHISPEGVNVREILDKARQLYKDGNLGGALQHYEEAYKWAPHYEVILQYLSDIHRLRGDHEQADLALKRGASLTQTAEMTLDLAQAALKRQDYDKASEYANVVVDQFDSLDKRSHRAKTILGDVTFLQGQMDMARKYYDDALYHDPTNVRTLVGRGTLYLTEHDYSSALQTFEKALLKHPHHERALIGRGLSFLGMGRKSEAVQMILEGLMLDPGNSQALAAVLPLLNEAGRLDAADEILEDYLRKYPDDSSMLLASAGVLYSLQRYEECSQKIEQLKTLTPELPGVEDLSREVERKLTPQPTPSGQPMMA